MNDIETNTSFPSDSESRWTEERWHLLGTSVPKTEIVYFSQMIIVYVIIITSITNLSLQNGSTELWISLLSSCIGYALPNPKLKMKCTSPFEPCSSICISGQTGSAKKQMGYQFLTHIWDMYARYTYTDSVLLRNLPTLIRRNRTKRTKLYKSTGVTVWERVKRVHRRPLP